MYRSNDRRIEIVLNIDTNDHLLPKLSDPKYQYSQLYKRQGFIRYYAAGVSIQFSEDFRRSLSRDTNAPSFTTATILCLSVDSKVQPDNETIFKTYRRVYIPFGTEVQSIKLDDLIYKTFPLTTDFSLIKIEQCNVDLNLKQATIHGTVPVEFTLDETDYDKWSYFTNKVQPLYSHIQKVMYRPELNLYENDFIANETFRMTTTILKNLDLLHSNDHNNNLNRPVREKLINALIGVDKLVIAPNGDAILSERSEDDPQSQQKKQPFAMGLYEYKGAYFKDRPEFESTMRYYIDMMGMTEQEALTIKKRDNRYEYMVIFLDYEQRLLEITEDEINDPTDVTFAMTDNERDEYELLRDKNDDKSKAARLELARAAKLKWKIANGRI